MRTEIGEDVWSNLPNNHLGPDRRLSRKPLKTVSPAVKELLYLVLSAQLRFRRQYSHKFVGCVPEPHAVVEDLVGQPDEPVFLHPRDCHQISFYGGKPSFSTSPIGKTGVCCHLCGNFPCVERGVRHMYLRYTRIRFRPRAKVGRAQHQNSGSHV